ncbi:amidohydrolase [Mycolicibacterium aubagnense]
MASPADLVVVGSIVTVDPQRPTAEALAVTAGRIVAVGSRDEVQPWIGADTEVREVAGCVLPGFVEAHGHPLMEAVVLGGTHGRHPARHHAER